MKHGSLKLLFIIFCFYSSICKSSPIEGDKVTVNILDKITSQIKQVEIEINDYYDYGSLKIEVFSCFKRPPEEIPENFVLLKVFDTLQKDEVALIFQGWMISSSPDATPFEHPIYDLWVIDCLIY